MGICRNTVKPPIRRPHEKQKKLRYDLSYDPYAKWTVGVLLQRQRYKVIDWPGVEHSASGRVRPFTVRSIGCRGSLTAASLVDHSAEALKKAFGAHMNL
jgi:hypothetical protein